MLTIANGSCLSLQTLVILPSAELLGGPYLGSQGRSIAISKSVFYAKNSNWLNGLQGLSQLLYPASIALAM